MHAQWKEWVTYRFKSCIFIPFDTHSGSQIQEIDHSFAAMTGNWPGLILNIRTHFTHLLLAFLRISLVQSTRRSH